jgi:MFS family permease
LESINIWRRQTRNWKIVSFRSIFTKFFDKLTFDYTNIYITALGANPVQLGLVNSLSHITWTLLSAPLGWFQDRYSLKKIFLMGAGLSILVTLVYATAQNWVMIIPAMLFSVTAMNIGSCLTICDVTLKDQDRSTCKGLCDGTFATLSLFAPTIAAAIITYFGGLTVEGIRPLYWIQLIAGIILLVFLLLTLREIERPKIQNINGIISGYRDVFNKGHALKRWIIFTTVHSFSLNMVNPFLQLYAFKVKGANQFVLGWMATVSLFILVTFSTILGGYADRVGRKKIIYIVEPIYAISIILLILAPSPVYLILSSALGGFNLIVGFVSITPMQVEMVPVEHRGRWRGVIGLFNGLLSIPAPIIGGLIWDRFSPSYLMLIPLILDVLIKIPILTTIKE